MADYGLDPSIVSYLQGVPPPDAQSFAEYGNLPGVVTGGVVPPTPPDPPPPIQSRPGRQKQIGEAAPVDEVPSYGLHPAVVAGVQGGFAPDGSLLQPPVIAAPTGDLPGAVAQPDLAVAPQTAPDVPVGTVATPTDAQIAQSNAGYDKKVAAKAAFDASPEGTMQRSDMENRAAIEKERQSNADALAAETASNTATQKALEASAQRRDEQAKIDQAKAAEDTANTAKYTQQYEQQVKDAADYKVDTDRHIGIGGLIAVALSGIGDALDHRHGPNAALQIIESGIDKRIADQWQQKDALGKKADATKGVLDQFRRNSDDDRQAQQLHLASETARAADDVRLIAAKYANPIAKARTEAIAAGLDQKAAAITAGEGQRKAAALRAQQEEADRKAQLGISYATLAETRREHDLAANAQKEAIIARLAEKDAAAAEKLKNEGVFDPRTGNVLLDPTGQKMDAVAKSVEQQAAAAQDPVAQTKLQKQADDIRAQAAAEHGFMLKDEKGEIKNQLAGAQRLVNATQRIRQALDDGSLFDRETRAALKTEADNAFTSWASLNDVKASSREYEVFKDSIGSLDGIAATGFNKGSLKASLDALDTGAKNTANTVLHSRGYKGDWSPVAGEPTAAPALTGKTSVERAADASPGIVTRALGVDISHPLTTPEARNPLTVENQGDLTPTGLAKQDDATVLNLIGQYGKKSPDDNQRIVTSLASMASSPMVYDGKNIVPVDDRKDALANAVLARLRGENPKLYKQVVESLPPINQQALKKLEVP